MKILTIEKVILREDVEYVLRTIDKVILREDVEHILRTIDKVILREDVEHVLRTIEKVILREDVEHVLRTIDKVILREDVEHVLRTIDKVIFREDVEHVLRTIDKVILREDVEHVLRTIDKVILREDTTTPPRLAILQQSCNAWAQPVFTFESDHEKDTMPGWSRDAFYGLQSSLLYPFITRGIYVPPPEFRVASGEHPLLELADFVAFVVARVIDHRIRYKECDLDDSNLGHVVYMSYENNGDLRCGGSVGFPFKERYRF